MTEQDFNFRLFADSNLIIEYLNGIKNSEAHKFFRLYKRVRKSFPQVELVTSSYVLWEFMGHMRDELYANYLHEKHGCGILPAVKTCSRHPFQKASAKVMAALKSDIEAAIRKIGMVVDIQNISKMPEFDKQVSAILLESKLTYKDAMVYTTAMLSNSHRLITSDRRLESEAQKNSSFLSKTKMLPLKPITDIETLRKEYRNWFNQEIAPKKVGVVANHFTVKNVLKITGKRKLTKGGYLRLVKFSEDNSMEKVDFKIVQMRKDEKECSAGCNVTVKPDKKLDARWDDALAFSLN